MILCSSSVRTNSPFETAMESIANAGFKDIDLLAINTWCHINPAELAINFDSIIDNVEKIFVKNGLTMHAMNIGFSHQMHDRKPESAEQNLKECDALCRFMKYFGASVAALQPLQKDVNRDPWEVLDDCIISFKEYSECTSRYGIKLGLELHVNSPFENREAMDYLFHNMPDAGIIYDPSHFTSQGMGLNASEFIIANSVHTHLRDSGQDNIQTPLGEGSVDFEWVAQKLTEYQYNGHFSIEYLDNPKWDALLEAVKMKELIEGNEKFNAINK